MNWTSRAFAYLAASLLATALPVPAAANCVLFLQLLRVDDRSQSYLRSDAGNERDRRISLTSALFIVDHMLEGMDTKALSPFLDVRRQLAHAEMSSLRENERDNYLLEMHRTRRDIAQRGESWGCVGVSREAGPKPVESSPSSSSPPSADGRKLLRSKTEHVASAGPSGSLLAGWLMLLGMILTPSGLGLWKFRRSRMKERYFCKVPCILHAGGVSAQAEIVDISRLGAKIKASGFDVSPGRAVSLRFGKNRVVLTVTWRNEHFLGGWFKKPISREVARGVSSGRQLREGAAGRGRSVRSAGDPGGV